MITSVDAPSLVCTTLHAFQRLCLVFLIRTSHKSCEGRAFSKTIPEAIVPRQSSLPTLCFWERGHRSGWVMANVDCENRGAGRGEPCKLYMNHLVKRRGPSRTKAVPLFPNQKLTEHLNTGLLTGSLAGARTGRDHPPIPPDQSIVPPCKHDRVAAFANFRSS